jgi:phage gpG-like protein
MLELAFDSSPIQVANDLYGFAEELDDMKPALTRIVNKVAIPGIRKNFDVGGRPPWEPLTADTLDRRGGSQPLVSTGKMRSKATSIRAWEINKQDAELIGSNVTEYAMFHQDGTRNMPARPWATLTPQEEEEAETEMVEWISEQLGKHGFGIFTSSLGAGDF